MEKKRYERVDPFTGFPEKDVKEDAPTTSTAGVAATGDDPTVVVRKKKKLYDGRTRIAKKFVERILKQREARKVTEEVELDEMRGVYVVRNQNGRMIAKNKNRNAIDKERKKYEKETGNKTTMNIEKEPVPDLKDEVELDEVLKPKDKKVIDDFVQANKGTGAQNFTKRGNIVDYEGRSLEKSGMGAQQIASLESDPKDDYKIKIRAKMDGKSTQSIVNYLKKSAKKYNVKVEHFERKFSSDVVETADSFNNEYLFVENNLKILQNIVKKKQNSKMKFKDNKTSIVDLDTASAIMNVYNAVKKDNKKKMEKLINGTLADFLKVQGVAFKAHRS